MGQTNWTDPTITPNVTPVRGVHIRELRNAFNHWLEFYEQEPVQWPQPIVDNVTAINPGEDLPLLRNLLDDLHDALGGNPFNWTDANPVVMRAVYVEELRAAMNHIEAEHCYACDYCDGHSPCATCDTDRGSPCASCDGDTVGPCALCDTDDPEPCPTCDGDTVQPCSTCDGDHGSPCASCDGDPGCDYCDGYAPCNCDNDSQIPCAACDGDGPIPCQTCDDDTQTPCAACDGDGPIPCQTCDDDISSPCQKCDTFYNRV